jgi:hypothetical protein
MATATVAAGTPRAQTTDILSLPFVRDLDAPWTDTDRRRHFWMPQADGLDFTAGCTLGEDYGLQAVRYMADHELPPLLGWVGLDLAGGRLAGGEKGAVVGFFSVFASLALWQAAGGVDRIERAFAERRARMAALVAAESRRGRKGRA